MNHVAMAGAKRKCSPQLIKIRMSKFHTRGLAEQRKHAPQTLIRFYAETAKMNPLSHFSRGLTGKKTAAYTYIVAACEASRHLPGPNTERTPGVGRPAGVIWLEEPDLHRSWHHWAVSELRA